MNETKTSTVHETDQIPDDIYDRYSDHNTAPLVKRSTSKSQTKQSITTTAIAFYQQHFGIASPYIVQEIERWIQDISGPLVLNAVKRTLEQHKPTWRYVKDILKSWQSKGIKTTQDVAADDHQFRSRHS